MTDREKLRWAISLVSEWREEFEWNELVDVFMRLEQIDGGDQNHDLWLALKDALKSNEALHDTELIRFLRDEELAAKGYWWYDPREWTGQPAHS